MIIRTKKELDDMFAEMDGDDVCRILVADAISFLRAGKYKEAEQTMIQIYGTDKPAENVCTG